MPDVTLKRIAFEVGCEKLRPPIHGREVAALGGGVLSAHDARRACGAEKLQASK